MAREPLHGSCARVAQRHAPAASAYVPGLPAVEAQAPRPGPRLLPLSLACPANHGQSHLARL
eukprot:scaffold84508_cov21-Tisochrysis_lutea.AAC.1